MCILLGQIKVLYTVVEIIHQVFIACLPGTVPSPSMSYNAWIILIMSQSTITYHHADQFVNSNNVQSFEFSSFL